jgi:hypothetical protein
MMLTEISPKRCGSWGIGASRKTTLIIGDLLKSVPLSCFRLNREAIQGRIYAADNKKVICLLQPEAWQNQRDCCQFF